MEPQAPDSSTGLKVSMQSYQKQSCHEAHNPACQRRDTEESQGSLSLDPSLTSNATSCLQTQTPLSEDRYISNLASGLDNAVLESMHTATTEFILQWPQFDMLESLRRECVSVFRLEQSRMPLKISSAPVYPYVGLEEIDAILDSFQTNVNFWYPTMSLAQLEVVRELAQSGRITDEGPEACLALLTLALGCACQATKSSVGADQSQLNENDAKNRAATLKLGGIYFEVALKKLHIAQMIVSTPATQCLFFVA